MVSTFTILPCEPKSATNTSAVNPIGLESLAWKFYFVYIAILVFECLCIWFLFVETKGPALEEIARLFDGNSANVAGKEALDAKAVSNQATAEEVEFV
jgi:hypothetical protein